MMKQLKRVLAFLLSFAMILALLPISALAEVQCTCESTDGTHTAECAVTKAAEEAARLAQEREEAEKAQAAAEKDAAAKAAANQAAPLNNGGDDPNPDNELNGEDNPDTINDNGGSDNDPDQIIDDTTDGNANGGAGDNDEPNDDDEIDDGDEIDDDDEDETVSDGLRGNKAFSLNGGLLAAPPSGSGTYKATFAVNPDNAGIVNPTSSQAKKISYLRGSKAAARNGYEFVNWTCNGKQVSGELELDAGTVQAQFTKGVITTIAFEANFSRIYTLSYSAGTGGSVNPGSEKVAEDAESATGSTATANAGYTFANWTQGETPVGTDAAFTPAKLASGWANASYRANFTESTVTLTYRSADEALGTVEGGPDADLPAATGTPTGATATPAENCYLVGWRKVGETAILSTESAFNGAKNEDGVYETAEYEAVFAKNPTVTFTIENGYLDVEGTPTTLSGQIAYNSDWSAVSVPTPVAGDGYILLPKTWNETAPGTVTEDVTITAAVVPADTQVTITFVAGDNGGFAGMAGTTSTAQVPIGSSADFVAGVAPTPNADQNYQFNGWSSAFAQAWEDATYTASFKRIETVSVTFRVSSVTENSYGKLRVNGALTNSVTVQAVVGANWSTISVPETVANTGTNGVEYMFVGWSPMKPDSTMVFEAGKNYEYEAQFVQKNGSDLEGTTMWGRYFITARVFNKSNLLTGVPQEFYSDVGEAGYTQFTVPTGLVTINNENHKYSKEITGLSDLGNTTAPNLSAAFANLETKLENQGYKGVSIPSDTTVHWNVIKYYDNATVYGQHAWNIDGYITIIVDDTAKYKVTYDYGNLYELIATPNITSKLNPMEENLAKGALVPFQYPEADGVKLVGWRLDGGSQILPTNYTMYMPEQDITLSAVWSTAARYTVEYYKMTDEGTYPATATNTETKYAGAGYELTITPDSNKYPGYVFDSTYTGNVLTATIAANGSTVFKVYYKNRFAYAVNYYLEGTTTPIATQKQGAAMTVGSQVTAQSEATAKGTIPGYTYKSGNPATLTITANESRNVINLYYTANAQKYTVNHLLKDSNPAVTLHDPEEKDTTFGATITGKDQAIEITGYEYDSVDPATLTVTETDANNVINVYYTAKNDVSYTVRYRLDSNNNIKVAEDKTVNNQTFGSKVTEFYKPVTGYELATGQQNPQTLTLNKYEGNVITFLYTVNSWNLTVKHVYGGVEDTEKGKQESTAFGTPISESKVDKDNYTFDNVKVDGFAWTNEKATPVTGTMPNKAVTITFTYTQDTATYTVNHYKQKLDFSGYDIVTADTATPSGAIGTTPTVAPNDYSPDYAYARTTYKTADTEAAATPLAIAEDGSLVINLYYDLAKYYVQYNSNLSKNSSKENADGYTAKEINEGEVLAAGNMFVQESVAEGKVFLHWTTVKNPNDNNGSVTFHEGDAIQPLSLFGEDNHTRVKLYAQWADAATVNYVAVGDGSVNPATETVALGNSTAAAGSTATANANNHFVGWYSDEGCTTAVDASWVTGGKLVPVAPSAGWPESTTYYAKFAPNTATYTVNHYKQNTDGTYPNPTDPSDKDNKTGNVGENTAAEVNHYDNYKAVTTGEKAWNQQTIKADGTTVVKIYYALDTYAVTYEYTGVIPEGAPAMPTENDKRVGDTVTVQGNPVLPGYDFSGWTVKDGVATVADNKFIMPAQAVTLQGSWTEKQVTINYEAAGNGAVDPGSETFNPETEDATGSKATADLGYHFVNWTKKGDTTGTPVSTDAEFVPTKLPTGWAAVTYVAHFAPNEDTKYTVNHYLEKLIYAEGATVAEKYDWEEKDDLTGTTGQNTAAAAKTYIGFTAQSFSQKTIAPDGSTVVDIYYNRGSYEWTINHLEKGTESSALATANTASARFGATIELGDYVKNDIDGFAYDSRDADIVIATEGNTANIYYTRNSYGYSVQHIYPDVDGAPNTLNHTDVGVDATYGQNVPFGKAMSTLTATPDQPTGYYYTHTEAEGTISSTEANNVIMVYYALNGSITVSLANEGVQHDGDPHYLTGVTITGDADITAANKLPAYADLEASIQYKQGETVVTDPTHVGVYDASFMGGKTTVRIQLTEESGYKTYSVNYVGATLTINPNVTYHDKQTKDTGVTVDPTTMPASPANGVYNEAFTVSGQKPAAKGYTFQGWATSADGQKAYDAGDSTDPLTANLDLYAVWSANVHTVTYLLDGVAYDVGAAYAGSFDYDTQLNRAAKAVNGAYTVSDWATSDVTVGTDGSYHMPDEDVTFTAASRGLITVNVNSNGFLYDGQSHDLTVTIAPAAGQTLKTTGITLATLKAKLEGNGKINVKRDSANAVVAYDVTFAPLEQGVNMVDAFRDGNGENDLWYDVAYAYDGMLMKETGSSAKLTINPRPVTITAGSKGQSYTVDGSGNAVPLTDATFTVSPAGAATGFIGQQGVETVTMTTASTISNPGTAANVIDSYTLKAGTDETNYTITKAPGVLTVHPVVTYVANTTAAVTGMPANLRDTSPAYGMNYTVSTATPARTDGMVFSGWNTQQNGGGTAYATGATVTALTSNLTLYAQWTQILYRVAYLPGAAGVGNMPAETQPIYAAGAAYTVSGLTPTRDGFTFVNWVTDNLAATTSYVGRNQTVTIPTNVALMTDNAVFLTAQWAAVEPEQFSATYTVNVVNAAGVTTETYNYATYTRAEGEAVPAAGTPARAGYTFSGWTGERAVMPAFNYTVTGTLTETAEVPPEEPPEEPIPPIEEIPEEATPLAGPQGASWALLNLILAIATALASALMLIGYIGKKKEQDENGIEIRQIKKHGVMRILSLLPGVGGIVAFILTENMKNPMAFTDKWTLLMVVIALIQLLVVLFSIKSEKDAENEQNIDAI